MGRIICFEIVFRVLGRTLFIVAGSLILCIPVALYYNERITPFLISSVISMVAGLILYLVPEPVNYIRVQRREAYLIVTLSWFVISLAGTMPYILSGAIPSFVDACFESFSGFTTTGASILTDIEVLPKSILFWRSITHWIGGIGIIVLLIVTMHAFRSGGHNLFSLESSLQGKFKPRIRTMSNRLLIIYGMLTFAEIILLLMGDMDFFDSLCHSFATISTGGFSPRNTSLTSYSAYIQVVVIIFMFFSGTNFVIHYYLIKKEFRRIGSNDELKSYVTIILVIGLGISLSLIIDLHKQPGEALREGFFQVVSIITCTGFSTADYLEWPKYAWIIIFLSMFIGGSTGSTSGGIKVARYVVLMKNISNTFRMQLFPNSVIPLHLNGKPLSRETNSTVLTFITIYFLFFTGVTILLVLLGVDIKTSASAVASCMANIGPGIGTIGPAGNYAHLSDLVKMILSFTMVVGRLEIYTVLLLFSRDFWNG